MTTYIYSRGSAVEQSTERQAKHLAKHYQHDFIVEESFTGSTTDMPKFRQLLNKLKSGDELIVKDVSRIGRDIAEVLEVSESLKDKDIHLVIDRQGGCGCC